MHCHTRKLSLSFFLPFWTPPSPPSLFIEALCPRPLNPPFLMDAVCEGGTSGLNLRLFLTILLLCDATRFVPASFTAGFLVEVYDAVFFYFSSTRHIDSVRCPGFFASYQQSYAPFPFQARIFSFLSNYRKADDSFPSRPDCRRSIFSF